MPRFWTWTASQHNIYHYAVDNHPPPDTHIFHSETETKLLSIVIHLLVLHIHNFILRISIRIPSEKVLYLEQ